MTQRELVRLLKASIQYIQRVSQTTEKPKGDDMEIVPMAHGRVAKVELNDLPIVLGHHWYLAAGKYAMTVIDGKKVYMHRLIMNPPAGFEIDHINGDGLDNRRHANLRICTHKSNIRAMKPTALGLSRFRGVTFDKSRNRWAAKITVDGKTINLGRFNDEEEAAQVYRKAAIEHFGADFREEAIHV